MGQGQILKIFTAWRIEQSQAGTSFEYGVFIPFMKWYPVSLTRRKSCPHSYLAVSPSSGVVDVMVAIGPLPVFVTALTLKVYDVEGLKFETITDVSFASETGISRFEPAPTTCTVYPVMIALCSPSCKGFQQMSAEAGILYLTLSPV